MKVEVSYIVNSVFTSKTYYLSIQSSPDVWLVDCGDVDVLDHDLENLKGEGFVVKGVLLTHTHYDHIYGLPRLRDMFSEVRVYTNEEGRVALANERINMSRYHEDPINYESEYVVVC